MRNLNTIEPSTAFNPYSPERGLVIDSSPYALTKKASNFLGGIAIDLDQADSHHVELHGPFDAAQLAKLQGPQKLTNAIHMIGQHMTDRVDAEIGKIKKQREN